MPVSTPITLRLAGLAVLAVAALSACGSPVAGDAHAVAGGASATSDPASATAAATATATSEAGGADAVTPSGHGQGGTSSGGTSSGGSSSGGTTSGGSSSGGKTSGGTSSGGTSSGGGSASGPAIASFRVVSQPVCATAGKPGKGATVAWSITGADGAALSVDNPSLYGAYGSSYPAKGQEELPFSCTPGGTTSHTYTVFPAGAKSTSKSLTVSARSDG